ncbi:MAG: choice-of-anchor Q domain-containing protein [Chitinophagaceae bacterium]
MNQKIYAILIALTLVFSANLALAQIQPEALRQIQLILQEKESRTPAQRKIDSRLLQAARETRGLKMTEGVNLEPAKLNMDNQGNIDVDVSAVVSDALIGKIEALGGRIIYPSWKFHTIRAQIKLSAVETVAGFAEVRFIEPAAIAITVGSGIPKNNLPGKGINRPIASPAAATEGTVFKSPRPSFKARAAMVRSRLEEHLRKQGVRMPFAGTVNSQGDRTHRADDTRNTFGYEGQGIRIGVLSDSYNALGGAAGDIASGNLPGVGNPLGNTTPVTVLADLPNRIDEGRAMLQIVHDLAPKAQLFFATAFISDASFADNILALRNAPYNCDIIIDDIFYFNEPVFQDGRIAQAVNTVTADGALYFSSAGNEGSLAKNTSGVWEGDFNDSGSPVFTFPAGAKSGTIHNFGTAATPLNGNIIIQTGLFYNLNWADPLGASGNDYDLFLVSATGIVKASSTNIQNGTQNPYEFMSVSPLVAGDRLAVFKAAAAQVVAFSVNTGRGRLTTATTGQIHGHTAAVDAFSVAAVPAAQPFGLPGSPTGPFPNPYSASDQVELFSSDGPRRMFFNADSTPVTPGNFLFGTNGGVVRNKPDITAADGTSTTVPGFIPFYGTSAAAPHAGAIAALLKSANIAQTPAQIRTILTSTALDIESAGYDNISGSGILQAFQAMQAVSPTPVSNISLGTFTTTEGTFSNNNGALDPGEQGSLVVQLTNPSLVEATGVNATISTTTPGVTIIQSTAAYGSIAPSGNALNTATPFTFVVNSSVPCGTTITFTIIVTFGGGGPSPQGFQFTVTTGSRAAPPITSALGSTPPTGPGFTSATGTQIGRLSRNTPVSSCGMQKITPVLADPAGARIFDSYTFTNPNAVNQCVTATLTATNGINLYLVAYNDSGFVPATPNRHFLADLGLSQATQTFSFTAPAGKSFTLVIHEVTPANAAGSPYTLNVSLSNCTPPPDCSPVEITTTTIATGATGSPYTQSFSASGGSNSGVYTFSLLGNLPAGLSFTGNTLSGTPTQAGSFPISIIANDPAGCPADTMNYTLVIAGIVPASVTATAGTPQTILPLTVLPITLQATVRDSSGNPLSGVNVIFSAPDTGASGRFAGGLSTVTVVTNSAGIAIAPAFTSNTITGTYTVTASVVGVTTPAVFTLTNFCPTVVTSNADSGPGTLRSILGAACPGITVTFDPGITMITLTSGELLINKGITIRGSGADKLTISGNNLSRIFHISADTSTVSISGITIRDGNPQATSPNGGGGILINNGAGAGAVNLTGCVITNNNVSLTGNPLGGGIDKEGGNLTIDHCSIINNTATFRGGGIQSQSFGSMSVINSTIAGNSAGATGIGGGIRTFLPLALSNCTIFGNAAQSGGNISRSGDTVTFNNTIIAGGILLGTGGTGPDISGVGFKSGDYNLIQNTAGATITGITTRNITGVSPNLLPLGNYGGIIPCLLPKPNSPVINRGDSALVSGTDQRGLPRVSGVRADIGAVETFYAFTASRGTPQSTRVTMPFPMPLAVKVTESGNDIGGVDVIFTAPLTGPSGTFPGPSATDTVTTNTSGIATSPVFTANDTIGSYSVTATIGTMFLPVSFNLTNLIRVPVTFGLMSASASNCTAQIRWETLTELNNNHFTVEHSSDGVNYIPLDIVPAKGNSNSKQLYSYSHLSAIKGNNYYRIKQTDLNGVYTYGSVMVVNNSCDRLPIVAFPNPVKNSLTVSLPGTSRQTLTVYDGKGRQITQYIVNGGTHKINASRWSSGMYTLTIGEKGKTTYTVKIIKN